jgi:hypothetical protein
MSDEQKSDFYVLGELCLSCRTPEAIAPDLIGFHDGPTPSDRYCYWKKQPSTPAEFERAVQAVHHCCCGAYRYCGGDELISGKLNPVDVDLP